MCVFKNIYFISLYYKVSLARPDGRFLDEMPIYRVQGDARCIVNDFQTVRIEVKPAGGYDNVVLVFKGEGSTLPQYSALIDNVVLERGRCRDIGTQFQ